MSDRGVVDRVPLGVLESGERYVGCLYFRSGVGFAGAVRLWHEVVVFVSQHFGWEFDVEDAEVCREYDCGAAEFIYDRPVVSGVVLHRHAAKGERQ